jgi:hypothetical protein
VDRPEPPDTGGSGAAGPDSTRAARAARDWARALVTVAAALAALYTTALLGLWSAGANAVPGGAFPAVTTAMVVLAVGGTLDLAGDAGPVAASGGATTAVPLSVTLAGAAALSAVFLRLLRHRSADGREVAALAGRIAFLWTLVLIGLAAGARHTFRIAPGGTLSDLGEIIGFAPTVSFRADVPLTVAFGLLWLAALLVLALLASRTTPQPPAPARLRAAAGPAARAMVLMLYAWVALAAATALVVAVTGNYPADTLAVALLALPNLAWPAFTIGLGAAWNGVAESPFGLPVPTALDTILRTPGGGTADLATLTAQDGRAWLLALAAGVLLLAAAVTAARAAARAPSPAPLRALAVFAAALVLTVLTVCLLARVDVRYTFSLFGLGDLGGLLSGRVTLLPDVWPALGLAALWGTVAGALGALAARYLPPR